jgi:hypothetical protein
MFPAEAKELKEKKRLHIPPFTYRLTKWNNVIRIWDKMENTSRDYEKHIAHLNNPSQKKLLEKSP